MSEIMECPTNMSLEATSVAETTATTTVKTDVVVPIATEIQTGVAYIATDAEIDEGKIDKAIHPCAPAFVTPEQVKKSIQDALIDYCFDEQWTGRHWVDGKKIYQKTLDCGALPAIGVKKIWHNISIDSIISAWGMTWHYQTGVWKGIPFINHVDGVNPLSVGLSVSPTDVQIESWNEANKNYTKTFITLQYTCTDR